MDVPAAGPPADVWVHPGVGRGRSLIDGEGLFARHDLDAGVLVVRLGGRLVSSGELEALLAAADPSDGYVDTITVCDDAHLVLPAGTTAHWCNHGCDPNLWHTGPYDIATRRPIQAGDGQRLLAADDLAQLASEIRSHLPQRHGR
jgi:hypothetical protein